MTFVQKTVRAQIFNRLPEFVRSDYPEFAKFISDYYEWMETDDNFQRLLIDFENNMEPTNQIKPFVDAILLDAGFDIELEGDLTILDEVKRDKELTKKKSALIHLLREFYLARGSKQSFNFIFNILFGEKAEIVYPRERMLIPSASNYGNTEKIFVAASANTTIDGKRKLDRMIENSKDTAGTVTGILSGAIASIEKITRILSDGSVFLEIEILEPNKEFFVEESVEIKIGEDFIFEIIQNVASFEIEIGGSDYREGDIISVTNAGIVGSAYVRSTTTGPIESLTIVSGGEDYTVGDMILARSTDDGFGFSAIVSEVDVNGAITEIQFDHGGYGYKIIPQIEIISQNGTGAVINPVSTKIGSIRSITQNAPYARLESGFSASVISSTGSGADLNIIPVTRFTKNSWLDHLGFVGERCTVIDSNKYQQFSYEIISPVNPQRYQTVVDDLLHPVGYVKTSVIEIQSHNNIGLFE